MDSRAAAVIARGPFEWKSRSGGTDLGLSCGCAGGVCKQCRDSTWSNCKKTRCRITANVASFIHFARGCPSPDDGGVTPSS